MRQSEYQIIKLNKDFLICFDINFYRLITLITEDYALL